MRLSAESISYIFSRSQPYPLKGELTNDSQIREEHRAQRSIPITSYDEFQGRVTLLYRIVPIFLSVHGFVWGPVIPTFYNHSRDSLLLIHTFRIHFLPNLSARIERFEDNPDISSKADDV